MRREQIGRATLYCGDAREIAPTLERPAAVISDPPYGQAYAQSNGRRGGTASRGARTRPSMGPIVGDSGPFDPAALIDLADNVLLWGAHKFWARLPDSGRWLFWDKRPNGVVRNQGCGEMAWHSQPGVVRVCRLLWDGVACGPGAAIDIVDGRLHPAQKPVALLRWCIQQAVVPSGGVILDPYMGSGTTGVAAVQMGHPFVGIEIEPRYFDTACRRVEAAQRQADLFVAPAAVPRVAPAVLL